MKISNYFNFLKVLKRKNFALLWVGQFVSQFGDRFNQLALIAMVSILAPGSAMEISKGLFVINFPTLLIGPIAGVYVDRWSRRKTMIISDVIRAILVGLIPFVVFTTKSLNALYVIILLVYIITTFFHPARAALVPNLVKKEEYTAANSCSLGASTISLILGAVAGDMIASFFGPSKGFYIDAGTYLFSAICLSFISLPRGIDERVSYKSPNFFIAFKKVFSELNEGLKYIFHNYIVRYIVSSFFILMGGAGPLFVSFTVFVKTAFKEIPGALGIIYSAQGLGWVLGMIFLNRHRKKLAGTTIIFWGVFIPAIFLMLFSYFLKLQLTTQILFIYIAICSLILGIAIGPFLIAQDTVLHQILPDRLRGRIFSARGAISTLFFLASTLIAGATITLENIQKTFFTISIIVSFFILINFLIFKYRERKLCLVANK